MDKTCKQCGEQFVVTDEDLDFYKKISPTFGGKTFDYAIPTQCPSCRSQRRMIWRNEKKLYKRKSDMSGQEIISVFSPDKEYKIYNQDEWWSDKWDPMQYGVKYDENKPFFEQFEQLYKSVPKANLVNINNENSDYLSYARGNKNSYLLFSAIDNEDCFFSGMIDYCVECSDCLACSHCTLCYEALESENCNSCSYIQKCEECMNSKYLYDCKNCNNCLYCAGLRHKDYHIFNKQVSEEEYKEFVKDWDKEENKIKFQEILLQNPRLYANLLKCENVTGDNDTNCSNCHLVFDVQNTKDSRYLTRSVNCESVLDCDYAFANYSAEGLDIDENASKNLFCVSCWTTANLLYCTNCFSSKNLIGCVGLRHKEYCILNKQYSKEEYENIAAKILEKMLENSEWGEFFPINIAPFGYNETIANEYFTLEKVEAQKLGAKWQDNDFGLKFDGPFYDPHQDTSIYVSSEEERNKLLNGILKCKVSGKPFKITPQELALYLKIGVSIPTKHYDVRFEERLKKRNPRKLYHRQCTCEESGHDHTGRCPNEFETTYAPDRPEKVYCESCYQKSVL